MKVTWLNNPIRVEVFSTCSWLEQRPAGSGGILISSGDMFLTFSENEADIKTEAHMSPHILSQPKLLQLAAKKGLL